MSDFTKLFLRDRLGDEKRPREFFGAFGKHPGWDDHIEDLPLPTASMAAAKQLLYVQGIGSQISSGAWTRLTEEARLPGFDHAFLWVRGPQFLAGRIWASRDGKGRAHFPMVVLVHGLGGMRNSALTSILARLENVAAVCRAARSADMVRQMISRAWGGAEETSDSDPADSDESNSKDASAVTLCVPRPVMLEIAGDFRASIPPFSRLPADPRDATRSLCFWFRVFTALTPSEMPLLFIAPLGQPWLDVLAGEPAPEKFFCLRAALRALPIARVSATQDSAAEMDADEFIKTASGGESPGGDRSWISRLLRH